MPAPAGPDRARAPGAGWRCTPAARSLPRPVARRPTARGSCDPASTPGSGGRAAGRAPPAGGAAVIAASPASAGTDGDVVLGAENDSGSRHTELSSTDPSATLGVINNAGGAAISVGTSSNASALGAIVAMAMAPKTAAVYA